jgi:hypothetical protein
MGSRIWILGGVAAPIVYVLAVVVGGLLTPGYSQIEGPISALAMNGAPAAYTVVALFALYNALLIAFAFTLRDALRPSGVRPSFLGPVALAVIAIVGVLMLVYPMDPLGAPSTETGRLHVFFSGIAGLSSMAAVLAMAVALGRHAAWRRFSLYSYVTLVVIVASGIWAASTASALSPDLGLAERVMVGAFLQWLLALAVALLGTA